MVMNDATEECVAPATRYPLCGVCRICGRIGLEYSDELSRETELKIGIFALEKLLWGLYYWPVGLVVRDPDC